nr:MAG: putative nonstructural protein [Locarnavirus sp.]
MATIKRINDFTLNSTYGSASLGVRSCVSAKSEPIMLPIIAKSATEEVKEIKKSECKLPWIVKSETYSHRIKRLIRFPPNHKKIAVFAEDERPQTRKAQRAPIQVDLTRYGIEPNPGPFFTNHCLKKMEEECLQSFAAQKRNSFSFLQLQSGTTSTLSPDTDYAVKLIENILTFVRLLSKAKDKEDYVLAVAAFAQFRSNKSVTGHLIEKWNEIMNFSLQDGTAADNFYKLKDILSKYETIKKLPIFTKLHKFILYCVGTSLFDRMGIKFDSKRYLHVEESVIKKEFHLGPDFIHCMLDTIVFLAETGYQCMVTGSIDPLLHHESTYEKWIQEGEVLRSQSRYIANPEPHGFTVFDFLSRLDANIDKGKSIAKFLSKADPASTIIRRLLSDLDMIRADCKTKRLAQQERKAPFAILVHGGSSVAKSQFTKMLYYHYGKLFGLPIDDEFKYTRNAFDQYWTNFNTSQWCIQLDDIAYLHPNKASECDPSLVEMLQVVNNVPYVPTQADLADKGKTPVRARFVIATSNTEHLNAETYFACPLAVQRRLPFVVSIEPKPEYARDGGPMIDPQKIPLSNAGEYPNLWRITIKKVVPSDTTTRRNLHMGQTAELVVTHIFDDIYPFLLWFNDQAKLADGTQDQAMKCDKDMRDAVLCEHFMPAANCVACSTAVLQAEEVTLPFVSPWTREFWRRRNQMEDEEPYTYNQSDPGYRFTIRGIFDVIMGMNLMTRMIVAYYYSMMWLVTKYPKFGTLVVGYFYGHWAWYIIGAKLLHLPEMRYVLLYMMGYRAYRAVRSPKVVVFCSSVLAAVTLVKVGRALWNIYDPPPPPPPIPNSEKFMCGDGQCGECQVCCERDKIYASGDPLPWWPEVISSAVIRNHAKKCNGECKRCLTVQGAAANRGSAPEPAGDKKENVWYKDVFECTSFDVSPSTLSKADWSMDQLVKFVSPNCISYTARVSTGETIIEKYGKATCIGGHTYLFNNHCIPFESFELSVVFQSAKDGISQNFTTLVTPSQLKRLPDQDILFIQLPSIPPKKDIRSLFAKESFEGRFDGEYIQRTKDGGIIRFPAKAPKKLEFNYDRDGILIQTMGWKTAVESDTAMGDCGSLLVSNTALGPLILGIHVMGGNMLTAIAISTPLEVIDSLQVDIFSDSLPNLQVGEYHQELVDLNPKATVRYIEQGTMIVYGSLAGFRGKMKSRVQPTFLNKVAVKSGYPVKTGPPVMNSWVPWRRALLDMSRPVSHIDLTLLEHCVDSFTNDILTGLLPEDLAELKVYDMHVAINGCPGVAYVDKMPRNTSAGFPFRKSKKYFLEAIPPVGEYQHAVKVTPEIEGEMDDIIEKYESGQVYCPVFTASLKDEPTAMKKIVEGKTRVFCGAPLPWSLVVRMYLLSTIRLIQKNRFIFEAGPGTIAQSTEWDDIYKYLTVHGKDRIVAGDYGKFDKRMPASVILAAFQIIKNILSHAGWTDSDLRVVGGIAEDTAFPTIDFHGELVRCYGTNPSGHPLTVIINGLANSLYVRYCYASTHPMRTCSDFKDHISLFTYGDDMIMGVSEKCTWLDHTKMQSVLASIDIEFTMAEKEAKSVPFIHIDQATFLRRRWRYEEAVGAMVCPIEHDSIEKMLTMCVASKTISAQLQAVAVLDTATREYFWYGEKVFEDRRKLFLEWIEELDLKIYMDRDLPTWEQLVSEFNYNSNLR